MLRIEITDTTLSVGASGSVAEISADLVRAVQELRTELCKTDNTGMFDFFLKELFTDLVFADGDMDEVAEILFKGMLKRTHKEHEAEHKQD